MDCDSLSRLKGTGRLPADLREPRTVVIRKTAGSISLGFNIVGGENGEGIYISFVLTGGAADQTGQVRRGDQILAVNGIDLRSATHEEAVQALKSAGDQVELVLVYRFDEYKRYEARMEDIRDAIVNCGPSQPLPTSLNSAAHNATVGVSSPIPVVTTSNSNAVVFGNGNGSGVNINMNLNISVNHNGDALIAQSVVGGIGSVRTTAKRSVYVRAQFDYDATRDAALPSRGLTFVRGSILHVLNASDDDWWQARLVIPSEARDIGAIGIIPSRRRVERKERARLKRVNFDANRDMMVQESAVTLSGSSARESKKMLRKLLLKGSSSTNVTAAAAGGNKDIQSGGTVLKSNLAGSKKTSASVTLVNHAAALSLSGSDADSDDIKAASQCDLTIRSYEAVTRYELSYARPVVILGPLKDRINEELLAEQPDLFVSCVPHTSRPPREHEVDGRDYHFVASRDEMERQIQSHLFIEAGQYNGHLYGTSVAAVRRAADCGRHCVLDVSCNAIKRLHSAGVFPIAVLIRPRDAAWIVEVTDHRTSDEQAFKQVEKCARMELEFGDFFTSILTGAGSYEQLLADVKRVLREHSGPFIWFPSNEPL